ncbi:uncharacterized protein LOC113513053 [Galleria mellonella]|uniref:Uncharacterized protein LOC113513053 n=1 Tax=Galleria mellonella TaxID=7137 RepID=A0A6J1WG24_GALME|nr:uncharacterized protein LOC113513053 [Galleria mellonella]
MALGFLIPKNFICRYSLRTGATVFGILMSCLMIVSCIATLIQVLSMDSRHSCGGFPWRNAYSFSITAVLYSLIMLAVNLWFIWGLKKEKASVVLSWVVITATWLIQLLCLMIVLLSMYSKEANFSAWLFSIIFTIIGYGILLYGCLIGYAYWLELKNKRRPSTPEIDE